MIGLDTNVIVRYLTKDDETQWRAANLIITSGEGCFITNVVLCELVWVLRGKPYKFERVDILKTIEAMIGSPTFEFENRSAVYQALLQAKVGSADFSDYLIGSVANLAGCSETVTFDRKLKNEKRFPCL